MGKTWYTHEEMLSKIYPNPKDRARAEVEIEKEREKLREEYRREISAKIRRERKRNGLTQEQLAKRLKTTRSVISRIEHAKQNLSLDYLARIFHALGKKLEVDAV